MHQAIIRRRFSVLYLAAAVLLGNLILVVSPARAATITVTVPEDELNSDGDCSLREAVKSANTDTATDACPAGSGADVITVPAGTYTLTVAGAGEDAAATGDLDLTQDVAVNGTGPDGTIIQGGASPFSGSDRLFENHAGVSSSLTGMTLRNGVTTGTDYGGAVRNAGNALALSHTIVSGNASPSGGAVMNDTPGSTGTMDISDSLFTGNKATTNSATANAIQNWHGTMTIDDSTIDSNSSTVAIEGAVTNIDRMTITDSAITNNSGSFGGGLNNNCCGNCCDSGPVVLTVKNTLIAGNHAGCCGGGFFSLDASATFVNVTVANNTSGGGGAGISLHGGTLALKNSIVANNTVNGSPANCNNSAVTSLGNNLESANTCFLDSDAANPDAADGDWINTDPQLGPIADNGGPTKTMALSKSSPAVDTANNTDCPDHDQRGFGRPVDGDANGTATCDIGSFEGQRYSLTVNKTGNGNGSVTSAPSGINCGSTCTSTFYEDDQVTLTADPADDSTFAGWGGACADETGDTCTLTMSEARTASANFALKPTYDLSVTKTGTGSGSVTSNPAGISCGTDCSESYVSGTSVTLTAVKAVGSFFQGWSGACSGTGTCTVSMTEARSVTATFTKILPTTTKLGKITKTEDKITVNGTLSPPHQGSVMKVTLFKQKANGDYAMVTTKDAPLSAPVDVGGDGTFESKFKATFARPNADKCRVKAAFPKDQDHKASSATKDFAC